METQSDGRRVLGRWEAYTKAKEAMLFYTDTADAPWTIVRSDDKNRARLNAIKYILHTIPYAGKDPDVVTAPDRAYRRVGQGDLRAWGKFARARGPSLEGAARRKRRPWKFHRLRPPLEARRVTCKSRDTRFRADLRLSKNFLEHGADARADIFHLVERNRRPAPQQGAQRFEHAPPPRAICPPRGRRGRGCRDRARGRKWPPDSENLPSPRSISSMLSSTSIRAGVFNTLKNTPALFSRRYISIKSIS